MSDEEEYEEYETVIQRAAMIAAPIFRSQNWTWGYSDVPPTVQEIADTFRLLADDMCADPEAEYFSTGRLTVCSEGEKEGLSFKVEVGTWWAQ